jgi:hypothetical protein
MKSKEEIELEVISEPTGCFCCGNKSDGFTVCTDCAVQMFIENLGAAHYCQKHNPERFQMILDWHDTLTPQNHETTI